MEVSKSILPMENNDPVNQPNHYTSQADDLLRKVRGVFVEDCDSVEIECIQAMVNMMDTVDQIRGYLRGNSFKYHWRYRRKAGIQDLQKARAYDSWLMQVERAIHEHCSIPF